MDFTAFLVLFRCSSISEKFDLMDSLRFFGILLDSLGFLGESLRFFEEMSYDC